MTDYTQALRSLMEQADIPSFRALAQQAAVSSWQIRQIRQGHVEQMRLGILLNISQALNISVATVTAQCSPVSLPSTAEDEKKEQQSPPSANLQLEYQRLKDQLEQQQKSLQQDFQRTSLQVIESWMTYWPAAVYAAQTKPDLPATRLIPLVRPVEHLLDQWGVEAIAAVGTEMPYDPQQHQLVEGHAEPGDLVRISNPGYIHNGALIHRAKVKPLQ